MKKLANKLETCSCTIIHEDIVEKVIKQMLDTELSLQLSALFKMFSDSTRIRLLSALLISEMCVCDLAASLNMSHSAVSHQLRLLKMYNLVKARKEGKVVYYSLADDHITHILNIGLEHVQE
ncbi:transcriptional regulator [Sporanaerobium hydrogeniformans]|uniref:Transcriptional regulator n=1 Tax=Sporanaerobium hydrogeniformans TaxID=3072179 RepID=A0AC61DGY8_9FIRM|nr:metalloregulator ArsR/SmtB family transcription factor [Sporanaerobium hydrogeniformans]PHV72466.1 transcriptional regulator [Sporanaerobium hydrogeniformans]